MCQFTLHNMSITVESYRLWLQHRKATHWKNTLYHKHKPTLTCFQVKMSHVAYFTAATSSGLTDEDHAWFIFFFVAQWPWSGDVWEQVYLWYVGLRWPNPIPVSWLAAYTLYLCSHSYCSYGCVSAHRTHHTHSHFFFFFFFVVPLHLLSYKTQPA